jgi:hypothetical protein
MASSPPTTLPFAEMGVKCSDTLRGYPGEPQNRTALAVLLAAQKLHEVQHISPHFGELNQGICGVWPRSTRRRESYHGPWNATLANPVALLSNLVTRRL